MKVSFFLVLLPFFLAFAHGAHGASIADDAILDLSQIGLAEEGKQPCSPGGRILETSLVTSVVRDLVEPRREHLSRIKVIDLSFNSMTDGALAAFIHALKERGLWLLFKDVQMVCLDGNPFTANVAHTLKEFLELFELSSGNASSYPYISIVDTPISLSKIEKVAVALGSSSDYSSAKHSAETSLMSHLVFMRKYYIWYARNRVQTYHKMAKTGLLPQGWALTQEGFYDSSPFHLWQSYRKKRKEDRWTNFVKSSLVFVDVSSAPSSSTCSRVATEDEIRTLAKAIGSLSISYEHEKDTE